MKERNRFLIMVSVFLGTKKTVVYVSLIVVMATLSGLLFGAKN